MYAQTHVCVCDSGLCDGTESNLPLTVSHVLSTLKQTDQKNKGE